MSVRHTLAAALAAVAVAAPANVSAQLIGPTPYLRFSDSPFFGLSGFSYFYLENFEDHLFNTPGVTGSAGGVTSVVFGPSIHDSVDEDDGSIDGSGLRGDDYFSASGGSGVRFTFNAITLGGLPTHVGLVWTDGLNSIFFEAFDGLGNSLGTLSGSHADGVFTGTTAEDRFYGIVNAGGVGSIFIRSGAGGGIELDHLQYGLNAPLTTTPEPETVWLIASGLTALVALRRRRRGTASR